MWIINWVFLKYFDFKITFYSNWRCFYECYHVWPQNKQPPKKQKYIKIIIKSLHITITHFGYGVHPVLIGDLNSLPALLGPVESLSWQYDAQGVLRDHETTPAGVIGSI